ncbi:hypothetical protein HYFRA_00001230 [Hymenoscyphus fraxineus]|uniref:Uncharacterized protein n=1 Tax=Hymenoscyphus fraxineus TaxID=746836 RepID=A0A9N9KTN4_9HELO|nr:hypothetical protein HYFRA_00001230 [Hymenoscyphus fraxineus]
MLSKVATLFTVAVGLASALPSTVLTSRGEGNCKPFSGNFTINQYQLYPENSDFDPRSCLLYISSLYNATVVVYDPYSAKVVDTLEFPGIAHNPAFHLAGIEVDKRSGLINIMPNTAAAFDTNGADVSGTNYLIQWDPTTRQVVYQVNLTETSQGQYGGFQDIAHDPLSNTYVVSTFGSSILKISPDGKKVIPWWLPHPINSSIVGTEGLAANEWILLSNDRTSGQLWSFDMRAETGVQVNVPISPPTDLGWSDAIYLPPKYHGTVLLVAQHQEDSAGVAVLRSRDGLWRRAEFLGQVPWAQGLGPWTTGTTWAVATVEVGGSLYVELENFLDAPVPGSAGGNRSVFPWVDITREVEVLVGA